MPDNEKNIPLECPSRQQKNSTEPIVNAVEKTLFPPKSDDVERIISKSQQE
ncbi:MAG: hypothetical protein J1E96_04005 [Ruminococcus sp.]|nr:hypothetical protein [Ruminococcus sp.]